MVTQNEVYNLIGEIGKEKGLDGEGCALLKRIAHVESNGNGKAKLPIREDGTRATDAYGLFQFLSRTWKYLVKKYPQELTMDGINSHRQQVIAAVYYTKENEQKLTTTLGNSPTLGQLYLAHFLGAEGALKVLTADPATRIDTLLPNSVIEKNGPFTDKDGKRHKGVRLELASGEEVLFKDFTARDLVVWANRKMAQPDGYELMSAEERKRYKKDNWIKDLLPDALGDMQMSSLAMIGLAIVALLGVVFSGSSSGSQTPPSTPQKGGDKGRGLFS